VQAPVASSLQIHLYDALHIAVPVELFCSCSLGAEGGGSGPLQYLLGIREYEGNRMLPEAPRPQPLQLHGLHHGAAIPELQHNHESPQESPANLMQLGPISEMHQTSSDGSESSISLLGISVWVDLGSEDLTCLRWTPSFAVIFQKPPQGAAFLQWLLQPERHELLAWLRSQAAASHSQTPLNITLKVPGHSNGQRAGRTKKRRFICSMVEDAQELVSSPSSPGATVVRLDLLAWKDRTPQSRLKRPPHLASRRSIWLWVNIETKDILRSQNAPGNLLKKGSRLVVCEETDQEDAGLSQRIATTIFRLTMSAQEAVCAGIGTYTLASGGFELCAEITLEDWGEAWHGKDAAWWLLSLDNVRLLGVADRPPARKCVDL